MPTSNTVITSSTSSSSITFSDLLKRDYKGAYRFWFPLDLFAATEYIAVISILKHRGSIGAKESDIGVEKRQALAQIFLPINLNLSESYQQEYEAQSTFENIVGMIPAKGVGNVARQAPDLYNKTLGAANDNIINPFMYMSFKQPSFREYELQWEMIPRNQNESKRLEDIINLIKFYSHPAFTDGSDGIGSSLFIQYPHEFRVQFLHKVVAGGAFSVNNYEQIIEPRFLTSFVKKMDVDYSGNNGQFSFFKNTRHRSVTRLSLLFIENEVFSKDKFVDIRIDTSEQVGSARYSNVLETFEG